MSAAAKPKFRSRKLDYKRPLPIFQAADLPDLDDDAHRAVPIVATGVEKEEEEEHHLQAVMSASQVNDAAPTIYIPTPDASRLIDHYAELYNRKFKRPTSFIRFSNTVEDCMGSLYCMDDNDVQWLESYNKSMPDPSLCLSELEFEALFTELERVTDDLQNDNPQYYASVTNVDGYLLLESPSNAVRNAVPKVHEYWKSRRTETGGKSIIPKLKFEEATKGELDPFICFRKREIRTTRKTRRADAQSVQKLRQLRAEMETAKMMLEMISRRERMRKELLVLEHAIFEQKILLKNTKVQLNVPDNVFEEARLARKKRAAKLRVTSSTRPLKQISHRKRKNSQTEDDNQYKDPIITAIENEVSIYRANNISWEDCTEAGVTIPTHPAANFFSPLEASVNTGIFAINETFSLRDIRIRRRIGRGGRIMIDRSLPFKVPSKFKYDNLGEASDGENSFDYCSNIDIETLISFKTSQPIDLGQLKLVHQSSKEIPEEPRPHFKFMGIQKSAKKTANR